MPMSDEHKRKISEANKRVWAERGKEILAQKSTPEKMAAVTEGKRRMWRERREELTRLIKEAINKPEVIAKKRARMLGAGNPQFGKPISDELKANFSVRFSGEGNPFFGHSHTDEVIAAISAKKRGTAPMLAKYGITPEEYAKQIALGFKWCCAHKGFSPYENFQSRNGKCVQNGRCNRCAKTAWLLKKFGVTADWYESTIAEQNGGCALCGEAAKEGYSLHADHHHRTGKLRGLVCFRCNSALERLDDVPGWIDRATAYLLKYTN